MSIILRSIPSRAAFLILLISTPLSAQVGSARVRGVVTDPSGAPVPQATASIRNVDTGATSTTKSNGVGEFSFPDLPVGRYQITVRAPGFKEFVQPDITLVGNQRFTINVPLQVGEVTETVTVSGAAAQVDTQTGTLKDTIDRKQIEDLPLNGRNPLQLVALSAGVFETGGGSNAQGSTVPGESYFSVNGQRTNTVNFELDGNDHNDPYTNVADPMPNPDALAEFSVQTSNYDAEYGRNSGAIVNATTKSGTNSLHGSAFEFIRNGDVNARNFFSTTNTDTLNRNQFGATLGGPVLIPHLYNGKNKSFFFFSYQGTRAHSASSSGFLTVPTAAEACGDFSALSTPITDPNTGQPFPGNIIPANRIDPYATKTLALLYPALSASTKDYFIQPNRTMDDQFLIRGDQNISDTEHLTLRYFHWHYETPYYAAPSGEYPASTTGVLGLNHNANIILTSTLSPRLVNLFTVGFNRLYTDQFLPPYITSRQLGLDVFSQPPDPMTLSIAGYSGVSFQPPVPNTRNTYTIQNATTLSIGRHLIKWGGEVQRIQQKWTFNNAFPNYDFNGSFTGNGLADFLLGKPFYLYEGGYQEMDTRFTGWALFVQDNYKITKKLTLDLGLRWDPWIPPHYVGINKIAEFSPQDAATGVHSQVYPNAPAGILYYGDPGVPKGGTNAAWRNFGPRIGFAYDLTGDSKTVFRGGYGIFYDQPKDIMWNHANDNPPFGAVAYLLAPGNAPYSYENPFNGQPNPILNIFNPNKNSSFPATPINGLFYFSDFHMPTIQQWNVSLERALPGGIVARASYVGSHGSHLIWVRDGNPPAWTPGATQANVNQRRPFYPTLGYTNTPFFDSWSKYNALEISVQPTLLKRDHVYGQLHPRKIDGRSLRFDRNDLFQSRRPLQFEP